VTISGQAALAELFRLLSRYLDDDVLVTPFSVQPAPHLGAFVVRVGDINIDLSAARGVVPDPGEAEPDEQTDPGRKRPKTH
jgi:hypothetical protein